MVDATLLESDNRPLTTIWQKVKVIWEKAASTCAHYVTRQPMRLPMTYTNVRTTSVYKKLSYRRGTARCVVSVEILPTATHQCRNYLYDKSWTIRSYGVGGSRWAGVQTLNRDAFESLSFFRCHKQTDDGRVVYITCIPTTCCGEILKVHNVEIAHVTMTTPT